ncbi:MAG: cofactor-independent phosphoglycerate mutase [Planctomycetes bacterium]|nr:cofactor-independent phosphoglycerate mutase [Planctomycetota bacterium]
MRYAILIPDGAADRPHPAIDGKTALEAADIPNMNRLAREGRLGLAETVPAGMKPGSDVANLSVLGYDPADVYTGRAPLEAASMGLTLEEGEAVFRANTVTVEDGMMKDYSAGHITTPESHAIVSRLAKDLGIGGVKLHPGIQYRHACIISGVADEIPGRTPPHDITGKAVDEHHPQGRHAAIIEEIEKRSRELLPAYEENIRRVSEGKNPVTQLWLWGGGVMPSLRKFSELYGIKGGLISAVDLLKGIAVLAGLEVIDVPGATGYYDTNYKGKGEAALECLSRSDFVAIHVEAPDEAGHNGDLENKIKALENIDRHILGPLLEEADRSGDIRILCLPDHPTPIEIRTHSSDPVPFALWGPGLEKSSGAAFTEKAAVGKERVKATKLVGMLTAK